MNFSIGSEVDLGDAMISEGDEDVSSSSYPSHHHAPHRLISTLEDSFGKYDDPHRPPSSSPSPFLKVSAGPYDYSVNKANCDAQHRLSLSTWNFDKEGLDARANVAEVPRSFFPALATSTTTTSAKYTPLTPNTVADNSFSTPSPNPNNNGSGDHPSWVMTTIEGHPITPQGSSSLNGTTNPTPGHYYSNSMHPPTNNPSYVSSSQGALGCGASSPTSSIGEVLPHLGGSGIIIGSGEHIIQRSVVIGGKGGSVLSPLGTASSNSFPCGSPTGRPVPRIQLLASRHKRRANNSNNASAYSLRTTSSASYSQGGGGGSTAARAEGDVAEQ